MSHHLHRIYARNAATVWELEARLMRAHGTFRPPAAVQWIATRSCDLRCGHCYSRAGHRHPDELTTDEARALIDELVAMGCSDLVIAGGEPLIRRDLAEIVRYAVSRGIRWSLHTHGGLVLRHRALFEQHPPALVAVSLDGPEAVHDAFRGRVGSFRAALDAVAFLRANADDGAQVVIGTTVTSRNADLLADMAGTVMDSGAHAWGLHLFAPEGRGAAHTALLPRPAQLRRVAQLARRLRRRMDVDLDNEWGSAGTRDPFYRDQPYLCGAGRFTCVVGVDGAIVPCTTTDLAEAEGNVRTHRLRDVWRDGFGRFRGDERAGCCGDGADCWLQTRNGNSCREAAFGTIPDRAPLPPLPRPPPVTRASRRNVRSLAVAAVVASLTLPPPTAAAGSGDDTGFPAEFDVSSWAYHHVLGDGLDRQPFQSEWAMFKQQHLLRRPAAGLQIPQLTAVMADAKKQEAAALLAALGEAEAIHAWDPWLVQQLWVRSGPGTPQELAALYARLEHHARVADALLLAMSETGPITYLPWRKKSAPPRDYRPLQVSSGLLDAAKEHYARIDAGTWRAEAAVACTVRSGTVTLLRQGAATDLSAGDALVFARFDVLLLSGEVDIGGHTIARQGTALHAWNLPDHLGHQAHLTLERQVTVAMRGDEAALDTLSEVLPLAHRMIREAVADNPDAPGAPALRQLLLLFDE